MSNRAKKAELWLPLIHLEDYPGFDKHSSENENAFSLLLVCLDVSSSYSILQFYHFVGRRHRNRMANWQFKV